MAEDSINNSKTIDRSLGDKSEKGELSSGSMLGQYRVIHLLGRGGMGEVYEVEHQVLRRRYALKLIPQELVSQKGFLERFKREAEVMAHLEHPHIVKVDDFGETGGRYWLRMELVEGVAVKGQNIRTLSDLADLSTGKIEQNLLAEILSQILDGLSYAHRKGAIHRDLKPANILLLGRDTSSISVKISDFGLVRLVGEEWVRSKAEQSVSIGMSLGEKATEEWQDKSGTSTRALLGTYEYMSPEQKRGEEVDARSDLYAVGLMTFRLLTGQKEIGFKLPSQINNEISPLWDKVVTRALEPEKDNRFNSAEETSGILSEVITVLVNPKKICKGARYKEQPELRERKKVSRKNQTRILVLLILLILLITIGYTGFRLTTQKNDTLVVVGFVLCLGVGGLLFAGLIVGVEWFKEEICARFCKWFWSLFDF